MAEWISVSDSLPIKQGRYKIKGWNGSINAKPFEEESVWFMRSNGTGYFGSCFDWKRATHWQTLPDPPEE
jgi:hypothetical protein